MGDMNSVIASARTAQSIALAKGLENVTAANVTSYLQDKADTLRDSVGKEHSDNFATTYANMVNTGNTIKNIMWYSQRNRDLYETQQSVLTRATNDATGLQRDNQTSKRQFEINEWTANNKLDTLFVLQLIFIGLMILVPLLYLTRVGIMPYSAYYGVSVLVLIAIILTFIVRLQYTAQTRDLRYWNRRRFARQGGPPTPPTCAEVSAAASSAATNVASAAQSFANAVGGTTVQQ